MATRSFIAHQTDSGFEGVYCHWDGYLSYNGRILRDHYSDAEKLKKLIASGDISVLAADIGNKHDFVIDPKALLLFTTVTGGMTGNNVAPDVIKVWEAC